MLSGVIALGLAAIPGMALDHPLALAARDRKDPPAPAQTEPGATFEITITFRSDKTAPDSAGERAMGDPPAVDRQTTDDRGRLLKYFTIAAISCALVGLVLGPVAWVREKQPALSGSAMAICCVALLWEYIIIGIAVGVAVVIVVLLLGHLA